MFNPPVNSKIQGLFNAFECILSTFQGKCNFQGLLKSPVYSSTFQACVNPVEYGRSSVRCYKVDG